VEDYLPVGNALGYSWNWRFSYSGGELLMMGASGEPSGYYPTDSNGVWVQSELSAPCKCPAVDPQAPMVCPPLGYGGCWGDECLGLQLFGSSPCAPPKPRPCNPKERKACEQFCRRLGGASSGCYHDGNQVVCSCVFPPDKPCAQKQRQACEKFCRARGGFLASCFVDNGKIVVCNCVF